MSDIKMSDVFDLPVEASEDFDDMEVEVSISLDLVDKYAEAACHAINNHDKLTSRVAELEAALGKIKDITGELGGQDPANFCEELAMEQDDATYRAYKISNKALCKTLKESEL